jgi:hypothetical protein
VYPNRLSNRNSNSIQSNLREKCQLTVKLTVRKLSMFFAL